VARGRFNMARGMSVYASAVDKAVWTSLRDLSSRRRVYRSYRASGLRDLCGRQLTDAFKSETGAVDHPPGVMRSAAFELIRLAIAASRFTFGPKGR
jgi:hypothetical protein